MFVFLYSLLLCRGDFYIDDARQISVFSLLHKGFLAVLEDHDKFDIYHSMLFSE